MFKEWRLPFRRRERSGLVVGEAASGKTTLLHTLMGMQNIETIPTIGFNVQEIPFKSSCKYTLWDVGGGCSKIRPLLKHYIAPDMFCIFLHDITSTEPSMQDSVDGFHMLLVDYAAAGGGRMFVTFTKQDLAETAAEAGASQDSTPRTVSSLAKRFEDVAAPFSTGPSAVKVKILPLPGFSASSRPCVDELMCIVHNTLQKPWEKLEDGKNKEAPPASTSEAPMSKTDGLFSADELLSSIKHQTTTEFWNEFSSGKLQSWDHAAHLRAGLGIILQGYLQPHGLFDWADEFLSHLERLRRQQPDLFRNTAHRTMTIFWLHRIHLALRTYMITQDHYDGQDDTGTVVPELDKFADIIRCDPALADRALWRGYYSQELMFSPAAKEGWCLPDLENLSDIVPATSRVEVTISQALASPAAVDPNYDLWLPRYAFTVIKSSLLSGARRGYVISHSLVALQQTTMRKRNRPQGPDAHQSKPPPYSETQAYFWMQYMHSLLQTVTGADSDGVKDDSGTVSQPSILSSTGLLQILSFKALQSLFDITGREWRTFYSPPAWNSIAARSQFVPPDLLQLPNIFPYPQSHSQKQALALLVKNEAYDNAYAHAEHNPMAEEEEAFFAELATSETSKALTRQL